MTRRNNVPIVTMIKSEAPPSSLRDALESDGSNAADRPRADDRSLFVSQLVEGHRPSLMRHLIGLLSARADAEDVLQETCRRLLEVPHLDRTGGRARAYMFRIATHLAYDRFRRRSTDSFESGNHDALSFDASDQPDVIVAFEQGLEIIRKTLLELEPRCRRVFLLRVAEGLRYESIARVLGISKRTVEREMKHALDTCQERLKR